MIKCLERDLKTYQIEHLLLGIELMIKEVDDSLHPIQLCQQVNFATIAAEDDLVSVFQGNTLQGKHVPVLGRDSVDLRTSTAANAVQPSVYLAVHAKDIPSLLRLRGSGSSSI